MIESYSSIPNNTNPKWWRDRALRWNVFHCTVAALNVIAMGYDQSLLTGLQAIPSWAKTFDSPKGAILGAMTSALFFPAIIFSPIAGRIGDRWGRKIVLWIGALLVVAGAAFMGACNTRGEFIASRVILGAGCAFTKVAAPALLQELAHPRLRGYLGPSYYANYLIGAIISSWLCFAGVYVHGSTWGWRFPVIIQCAIMAGVAVLVYFVPESPRYLVSRGREQEAFNILVKYHANGDQDDALVEWEFREIKAVLAAERESKKSGYLDFCRTPGNRRRLLAILTLHIGANWCGNGLTSYYLSPILKSVGLTDSVKITGVNGGLSIWNAMASFLGAYCAFRFGRRPLLLVTTAGMLVAYCLITGLSAGYVTTGKSSIGVAVIPMLFLYELFHQSGWTPMPYGYISEILPYGLRTKGLAIAVMSNQTGNGFNQLVNPIALNSIGWKYYPLYIALLILFWTIIYFFFPETKGLTLEEISFVFDHGVKGAREAATADAEARTRNMINEKGRVEETNEGQNDKELEDRREHV